MKVSYTTPAVKAQKAVPGKPATDTTPEVAEVPAVEARESETKEVEAKKYAMPTKGQEVRIKVNGVDVDALTTKGRDQAYTYFVYKNESLYIPGTLPDGTEVTLEEPADYKWPVEPPAARKSYYVRKRPLNPDGSVPAGSSDAEGAAKTVDAGTPDERSVTPDGKTIQTRADLEAGAEPVGTEAGGEPPAADAEPVAPKPRRKGK